MHEAAVVFSVNSYPTRGYSVASGPGQLPALTQALPRVRPGHCCPSQESAYRGQEHWGNAGSSSHPAREWRAELCRSREVLEEAAFLTSPGPWLPLPCHQHPQVPPWRWHCAPGHRGRGSLTRATLPASTQLPGTPCTSCAFQSHSAALPLGFLVREIHASTDRASRPSTVNSHWSSWENQQGEGSSGFYFECVFPTCSHSEDGDNHTTQSQAPPFTSQLIISTSWTWKCFLRRRLRTRAGRRCPELLPKHSLGKAVLPDRVHHPSRDILFPQKCIKIQTLHRYLDKHQKAETYGHPWLACRALQDSKRQEGHTGEEDCFYPDLEVGIQGSALWVNGQSKHCCTELP